MSRSVTLVVAWLMKIHHFTLQNALRLVQEVRPIARPNPGFMRQLKEFEAQCFARRTETSID